MATKEELLEKLKEGVVEYQEDDVKEAAQQGLDDGHDALELIMDGLAAGMEIVGDLYDRNEYYVPEKKPVLRSYRFGRSVAVYDAQPPHSCFPASSSTGTPT